MGIQEIFLLQFVMSLLVWGLLSYWLLVPWLRNKPKNEALFLLTIPHAFRYIGLAFLVPNLNAGTLPKTFASPAAYGDLLASFLAIIALVALRANWSFARVLAWVFCIAGTLDLLNALRQADAIAGFGATWFIPTMIVPLLLVTHFLIFVRLIKGSAA